MGFGKSDTLGIKSEKERLVRRTRKQHRSMPVPTTREAEIKQFLSRSPGMLSLDYFYAETAGNSSEAGKERKLPTSWISSSFKAGIILNNKSIIGFEQQRENGNPPRMRKPPPKIAVKRFKLTEIKTGPSENDPDKLKETISLGYCLNKQIFNYLFLVLNAYNILFSISITRPGVKRPGYKFD